MERVYFSINEAGAKTANDMMSFSEYKTGSKTAGYKAQVDKAYELAEKVIEARPTEEERVSKLCERYSRRLAQNINKDIQIGMMCPSVMISGAGNFPVKKKEKQVAAWDKNHEDYKEVEAILGKIEAIFYGKDVIKSDDENAIEKLQDKVDGLREDQERMKQANKAIRMSNETKQAICDAFDKIKEEYNVRINNIDLESLGSGNEKVPFQYVPENVGGFLKYKLVLNKDYDFNGSLEAFSARIMRNHNNNVLAAQNVEDLIAHEMAHVLTFQNCDIYGLFLQMEEKVRNSLLEVVHYMRIVRMMELKQ